MSKSSIKTITFIVSVILIFGCRFIERFIALPKPVKIICPLIGLIVMFVGIFINDKKE